MAIYTQFTDESTIEAAYEVLGRADLVPVGIPTTSRLTLAAAGLETILFAQGLQYRADSGEFLAGTVTGLETRFQSKLLYRFEGLSLAATELNTLSVFTAGMAGDDTLIGSPFADLLYGADGADRYQAGAGNDEMYGVFGGDRYDGGTGLDRVLYGLDSGLATITAQSPSTFTVRFSAGGTDTLSRCRVRRFQRPQRIAARAGAGCAGGARCHRHSGVPVRQGRQRSVLLHRQPRRTRPDPRRAAGVSL
jgi:hypothetical protein